MNIELFYDLESSYSYLAFTALDRYVPAVWPGVELVLRPALLGGVFKAVGNVPPATLPARAPYLVSDMARLARWYGVPMQIPDGFPSTSLQVMRALTAVSQREPAKLRDVTRALYRAHWGEGKAVDTPEAWAAAGAGFVDAATVQDPAIKDALKKTTEEAVARGAFGFPAMFVDGGDLFFGADRIELLAREHGLPWRGPAPA